jgi:very-short-patch-repair endonuclease
MTSRRRSSYDRRRDQRLMLAGFRVARPPWQQVTQEPSTVEKTVRALIDQASINPRRIA